MAHGGYGTRRVSGRGAFSSGDRSSGGRGHPRVKGAHGVRKDTENKKSKIVSIKNQIRSIERLLKKPLLAEEVKDAQEKRLEDMKKQAEQHARSELERKMALRYRKVKFFERRKIERRIRRAEKQLRTLGDQNAAEGLSLSKQLEQLKEDLEYVKFFPKTEKYVALYAGNDDELVAVRNELRKRIKANIAAAAAAGVDLEETGSEDEAMDLSDDDFFMAGSSSDDADADDELTDKSPRLGDRDDVPKQVPPIPRTPINKKRQLKVFDKSSKRFSFASKDGPKDEMQKPAKSFSEGPSRVKSRPQAKQTGVKPWTSSSGGNSRPSSSTGNSRPSSSAGNSRQPSVTWNGKSSFAGNNRQPSFAGSNRSSSSAVNVRKTFNRPVRALAHHSSVSDENTNGRSSVTSSYSIDDAQQAKKRKRTRSKKKKN